MRGRADSAQPQVLAPWRVLAIALALATVLAAMGASQSHAWYAVNGGTSPPWRQSLLWSAAQWYAWAAFVPLIVALGVRFNFSGASGTRLAARVLLHVVLALCFALAHLLLQTSILWFLLPGGRKLLGGFATGMLTQLVTTLQWELLSYALVLMATHVALYLRRAQVEALTRQEVETRAAHAQLAALKQQMQPHFLFNALNALVAMQREDSSEQRFTIRLAEMLRLLLAGGDSASSTLASELALVKAYLHVEQARLGARLRTVIDVPDFLDATPLPSFILQPLVENAITHGVACDPSGGEIDVQARRAGGEVVIEITNGWRRQHGLPPNRGFGIALDNCRRRLALLHGAAGRLDAGPLPNERFRATIVVPAIATGAAA